MRESMSNIDIVSSDASPKVGQFKDHDPKFFLGKHVKLSFDVKHPQTLTPTKEHMWVKVNDLSCQDDELLGELENDPLFICNYKCGSIIAFNLSEIEEVL